MVGTGDGRTLWVTGGGSGMGRAAVLAAAESGWRVAVSGRRRDAVEETAALVQERGGEALAVPVDVRDGAAVRVAHEEIARKWATVHDVVLAAGLNTPSRDWANQDVDELAAIVDTNLTAVARVIDVVLPGMRASGGGRLVVISSRAAWRFSPRSGVAYMASKTAVGSLCASLNDQEGEHGIAACHLCPGDVDTDFLELRPEVPDAGQRAGMLTPDDVGRAVRFVLESPSHVRVDELVITPVGQR